MTVTGITRSGEQLARRSILISSLTAVACSAQRPTGPAMHSPNPTPVEGVVRVETVAEGLRNPWGLAMLPDGRMLVTERGGALRIVGANGGVSAALSGVPAVEASGQG